MLQYGRIDVSEGTDFSKINGSYEWTICHYCYFLKVNFRFQAIVCDVCHGLMQKVTGLNDVAIVYVEKMIIEFIFCIWVINRSINLLSWFYWKKWNIIKHKNLLSHIKMAKEIITFDIEIGKHKFHCYKNPIF